MTRYFLILILFLSPPVTGPIEAQKQIPLIWDTQRLEQTEKNHTNAKRIIDNADTYCNIREVVVTEKEKTFAPNNHYYCSIGPYWWPDTLNGKKYINRDGHFNPEIKQFDYYKLIDLSNRCENLSKAFYITHNPKYYNALLVQLKSWFVNKKTYMKPTFMYSQVIPGQNDNKGRSTGMIDAYLFNNILESIRLVNSIKRIDRKTMKSIQKWIRDFADDSFERYDRLFSKSNTNISLAYDVTMVNMYLFASEEMKAKQIADQFAERRIEAQINADGSQPSELKRTRAFFYSMYNLGHIIDFCYIARYWYPNYYNDHKVKIDMAFEFLGKYVDTPETFPYQQISNWADCQQDYYRQLDRLNKLK